MPPRDPVTQFATHEVTNQPPPLVGYSLYESDPILGEALHRDGIGMGGGKAKRVGGALTL